MLNLQVFTSFDQGDEIKTFWNKLVDSHEGADALFLSFDWLSCWWEHFGGDSSLQLLIISDDKEVTGIAPLMIRKGSLRGLPVRILGFLENGNTLHNGMLIRKGKESEVAEAVTDYLEAKSHLWDMVELVNYPSEAVFFSHFVNVFKRKGLHFAKKEMDSSPYISLNMPWETFYTSRTQRTKKALRNIANKFKKAGNTTVHKITDYAGFTEKREQLAEIARNSWTGKIGDSLASEKNAGFFDDLTKVMSKKGRFILWLLELNGESIAFEYHLKFGKRIYGLRSSYKEKYKNISPGVYLDRQIVESYFDDPDLDEYDLGGIFDFYKKKWTDDVRFHNKLVIYKKGFYSSLLYFYEEIIVEAVKKLLRGRKTQEVAS